MTIITEHVSDDNVRRALQQTRRVLDDLNDEEALIASRVVQIIGYNNPDDASTLYDQLLKEYPEHENLILALEPATWTNCGYLARHEQCAAAPLAGRQEPATYHAPRNSRRWIDERVTKNKRSAREARATAASVAQAHGYAEENLIEGREERAQTTDYPGDDHGQQDRTFLRALTHLPCLICDSERSVFDIRKRPDGLCLSCYESGQRGYALRPVFNPVTYAVDVCETIVRLHPTGARARLKKVWSFYDPARVHAKQARFRNAVASVRVVIAEWGKTAFAAAPPARTTTQPTPTARPEVSAEAANPAEPAEAAHEHREAPAASEDCAAQPEPAPAASTTAHTPSSPAEPEKTAEPARPAVSLPHAPSGRIRVHAVAKLAHCTAAEILTALAELEISATVAQSTLTHADAARALEHLGITATVAAPATTRPEPAGPVCIGTCTGERDPRDCRTITNPEHDLCPGCRDAIQRTTCTTDKCTQPRTPADAVGISDDDGRCLTHRRLHQHPHCQRCGTTRTPADVADPAIADTFCAGCRQPATLD